MRFIVYYCVFLLIRVVCVASFKVGEIDLSLPAYAAACEGACVAYAVVCVASCKVGLGCHALGGGGGDILLAFFPLLPFSSLPLSRCWY